jgi:hypothetical protein
MNIFNRIAVQAIVIWLWLTGFCVICVGLYHSVIFVVGVTQ